MSQSDGSGREPIRGGDLRASDTDRERVAEAVRAAAGDGRLTLTELDERLDAVFRARTYAELSPITADLPEGPYPVPDAYPPGSSPSATAANFGARPPATADSGPIAPARPGDPKISAILSSEKREGRWQVPQRMDVTCVLGDVTLDLTEAVVTHSDVHLQLGVALGEVTIIVPDGANVVFESGTAVMGERVSKLTGTPTPGAPVLHVHGFTFLGSVTVRPPRAGLSKGILGS